MFMGDTCPSCQANKFADVHAVESQRRETALAARDPLACPNCGGKKTQPAGVLKRHARLWLIFSVGWLMSSLWSASRNQQVCCVDCGTLYEQPTRASKTALFFLVLLILLVALGIWIQSSAAGGR